MNISTTQKRRFLENVYKLYYSNGIKPTSQQVLKAFTDYFSVNQPGFPVGLGYVDVNDSDRTSADTINQIMINTLFNIDILYDTILENSDELFMVSTTFNKKFEKLKTKRKMLESKVDDLLFVNNNSDGYFYSYTENFSSIAKIDALLTTGYVDTASGCAVLSSENSDRYSIFSVDNIPDIKPQVIVYHNGLPVSANIPINTFSNVLDGLTDTYWEFSTSTTSPIPVAVSINIPMNNNIIISKIEGHLSTASPVLTQIKATPSDGSPQQVYTKKSNLDYDVFNFSITPKNYSSIELIFLKNEPDYILNDNSSPYVYTFKLKELIINSVAKSNSGSIVSRPISLPNNINNQLVIDSVSLDSDEQNNQDGSIFYYVAADDPNAVSIYDFNWIPISAISSNDPSFSSTVNFNGSLKNIKYISSTPKENELQQIPIDADSKNLNDRNPNFNMYQDKEVYRIAALSETENYISPILLGDLNSFNHYYVLGSETQIYKDINYWTNEINDVNSNLLISKLIQNLGTISTGLTQPSYGYVQTKIICDTENKVVNNIKKSISTFDLAVYLNGSKIADLPSGKLNLNVEWFLMKGINDVVITYNKPNSGVVSFSLTDGVDLSAYGTVFTDYFYYLDSFDFRNKNMNDNLYFTIDNPFGRKEIISSAPLINLSRFSYISNTNNSPSAIRYRIDLNRYQNPFTSPKVDSLKIKFKHNNQ